MRIFAFVILMMTTARATARPGELSFVRGEINYQMSYAAGNLSVRDRHGARSLAHRACNSALIDAFWQRVERTVTEARGREIQRPAGGRGRAVHSGQRRHVAASVRWNDTQISLAAWDSALKYFTHLPEDSDALFLESATSCSK